MILRILLEIVGGHHLMTNFFGVSSQSPSLTKYPWERPSIHYHGALCLNLSFVPCPSERRMDRGCDRCPPCTGPPSFPQRSIHSYTIKAPVCLFRPYLSARILTCQTGDSVAIRSRRDPNSSLSVIHIPGLVWIESDGHSGETQDVYVWPRGAKRWARIMMITFEGPIGGHRIVLRRHSRGYSFSSVFLEQPFLHPIGCRIISWGPWTSPIGHPPPRDVSHLCKSRPTVRECNCAGFVGICFESLSLLTDP
ncbi:hypothetical protein EDB89DRAFT_320894 [Lactarius sanguifluus]|nr:hypothetical protein EDB89DRAFT_320894 [Lactarius sanguifluus]